MLNGDLLKNKKHKKNNSTRMLHVCFTCGWEPHTQKTSGQLLWISQRTYIHCSNAHSLCILAQTVLLLFLTIGIFAANSKSLIHAVSSEHLMFEFFGSKRVSLGDAEKAKGWFLHGSRSEMVWGCLPMTSLVIYSKSKVPLN